MKSRKHEKEVKLPASDFERAKLLCTEILARFNELGEISKTAIRAVHPESIEKLAGLPPKGGTITTESFLRSCYGSGEGMCICYDYDRGVCRVCSSTEGYTP